MPAKNPVIDEIRSRVDSGSDPFPAPSPPERINQILTMQGNVPTLDQIMQLPPDKQLAMLQTRKMLMELIQEETNKAADKNFRLTAIQSWKKKIAEDDARQRRCAHLKENGTTALAGQRDMDNNLHLVCQFCMKLFTGSEIPPHLMPKASEIGGFAGAGPAY